MTLPNERTRAIQYAREFLRDLLDASLTPKVPIYVRKRAANVLKHFPTNYDLKEVAKTLPDTFGTPDELED